MEDTFHSECNFEDVEGEFHTELDTQHRPVITHLAFRGTTSASKDIEGEFRTELRPVITHEPTDDVGFSGARN